MGHKTSPIDSSRRRFHSLILGFMLGGALACGALVAERVLHHGYVYRTLADALLHLSIALLVGMGLGLAIGGLGAVVDWHLLQLPEPQKTRRLVRASAIAGLMVGALVYVLIVLPSKYGHTLNPVLGSAVFGLVSAAAGGFALSTVAAIVRNRPRMVALGSLCIAAAIAWADMHMYLRSYGNVHVIATLATFVLSGLGGSLLSMSARTVRPLGWLVAGLVVACGTYPALARGSMSARMAVLDFGGAEKLVIRHVLWPLFDGDKDGHAQRFWGADCDDTDPSIIPTMPPYRLRAFGCDPVAPHLPSPARQLSGSVGEPTRSLVWVLIDTWRADVPRATPAVLATFRRFVGFRSCGSRTQEVVNELLGSRGCIPGGLDGSVPAVLEKAGYAAHAFVQYDAVTGLFSHSQYSATTEGVLQAARTWIGEQKRNGVPYFAYVHLKGGHAPYDGAGRTDRERYEASITNSIDEVRLLIESLGRDPVVIVMGDHGEEFGEHEGNAHASSLYEEVLAASLYIRAPGWPDGVETGSLGCGDLRRTIWRALAGEPYGYMPSEGMFATLDSPAGIHGGISRELSHSQRFDSTWKVIWRPNVDIWELYDLETDNGERNNLADEQPDRLRRGASLLLGTMAACRRGLRSASR
jgi:hypothetical protein